MLILIEFGLVAIAVVLAFCCPDLGSEWFEIVESAFAKIAKRRSLSVLFVAAIALAARGAVFPVLPIPEPRADDEFSHLFLADTLLHGRLTNPSHPMWIHFETFDINMRPTYASVYPPAQGTVLAAGTLLGGSPFVGVWLSVAAMCAAICWMLQEWISPEWALWGGLIAVMRFGVFSYWSNSYWGGAVAALGGALAVGALLRVMRFERTRDVCWLGLGLAILANSRPYEGFVLGIPLAIALLGWLIPKKGPALWTTIRRVVMPLTVIMCCAVTAMGYYFWRVTGSPVRTPYQVYWQNYAVMPKFIWESARSIPAYRHEAMREYNLMFELPIYTGTRSIADLFATWSLRFKDLALFYLGPALLVTTVIAIMSTHYGFRWRDFDWSTRFLLVCIALSIVGLAVEVFCVPHYASPMTAIFVAISLVTLRHLRNWKPRGRPSGLFLTRAIPLICLLTLGLRTSARPLHIPIEPLWPPTAYNSASEHTYRGRIQSQLNTTPGRHLVLVRYEPHTSQGFHHWPHEWVFNDPDIDRAKIVWAWDMGPTENQELLNYFKGRDVWLVRLGDSPPNLLPYPDTASLGLNLTTDGPTK